MAESIIKEEEKEGEIENHAEAEASGSAMEKEMSRKEKRKALKKMKRKQARREIAATEREEEEARLNDPEAQMRIRLMEQEEVERSERERKEFEEREKAWHEAMELKKKKVIEQEEEEEEEEEERKRKALDQDSRREQVENANEGNESDDWEYVEDGPAEIIWQGNEIIFKKKKIRVPKKKEPEELDKKVDANRPASNPLPPESEAFLEYRNSLVSTQDLIDSVAQQVPNFGTEQDKAHCPFHLKTGACRFGQRCSRVHFYPDKSCTLLIKNMYNGPGLAWEQDEGLEHTDEEVERCYEEFYEDVHTEFLKFGEIVNFKVCRNGSSHLRGNVYVHFKSLDSAVLAHHYINGRFFAGKQINCEFVNITRWKVAICGEYMKSRFKTCSRGMACNFIHCFRNPGGDYEWADSDKPPPRYWFRKMAFLFGYFDESACERQRVPENLDQPNRSGKISTADADRHRSRRSGSRETDHLQHSGSGRRKNLDGYVQRKADQLRSTTGGKEEIGSFNEDVREESMRLKLSHHRKRKHHTDTEDSYDDGGQISGDEYHDYTRKRSRKKSDNKNTPESDIDGDWLAREREKERHHGGTRKSSKYHRKTEKLDDYGDHESRDHEVYEDMRNKGRDGEAYHGSSSRRSHKKAGYPGDHRDSKNRSHDADRERLDKDSDGNRHCSRGRSSGLHRKVEIFWDDHDRNGNRDEWLDIDEARSGSYSRGHLDEALAFSDDGEPAKRLKDRRGHSSRDISKADSCDENLRSDRSGDSSCSSQCDERFDSRYNFDVQIEKRDRWEPEQHSYERRHKSSGKDSNSEYDSEPYYSSKARNDYPAKSEETALKHHKSKRKSDRRSRSSCKLSHRRHQNSSDEGLF